MKLEMIDRANFDVSIKNTSQSTEKKDFGLEQNIEKEFKTSVAKYIEENPGYRPNIGEDALIKAIESANKKLQGANREFQFSIHEGTKQIMVKVMNAETKELIREIPPEKVLDMVAKMWELVGLVVDEKI